MNNKVEPDNTAVRVALWRALHREVFTMSFMLLIELADPEVRPAIERAAAGARANGTPFISFFRPTEMLALARAAGFRDVSHVSAAMLAERYFAGGTDGLRPPNNSEELLVATV